MLYSRLFMVVKVLQQGFIYLFVQVFFYNL